MPWPLKVLVSIIFFVLCVAASTAVAQDITVQVGTPVSLVADSNVGPPNTNGTPCGPDNSLTCNGGTLQPNGNIQWTVDGASVSSSYDTVKSSSSYCSADNVNYYTYCSSYWDESGYTAVLPVGSHTITASISAAQDQYAAFTKTWTVLVTGSSVSSPQVIIYNFSAKDGSGNPGYAPNGNLLNYSDTVTGTWTMSYDAVNRLRTGVAANGPYSGASITWDYDSFGNRLHQNVTGNPNVPTAWATYYPNNQLSTNQLAPNDKTLAYDPSGNMIFDGTNNVIYDGEGRVCAVAAYNAATQSILVTQYLYDAEGNRIAKGHPIGNSSTPSCPTSSTDFQPDEKYILGQNGEQVTQLDGSDNWQHTNIWVGRQLLATYDNQSIIINGQTIAQPLHFNVTDPLGTKRLQVSAVGVPEMTCVSLPFGEGPDCSGTEATRHRFTGKERDTESGLDYFGARYYASSMGRWMSPDWADKPEAVPYSSLGDPQSLNLYQYVGNNPLSRADADGHCCTWDDAKAFGSGFADASYRPFVQAVSHPGDTLSNLGSAIAHPGTSIPAMYNAVVDTGKAALSGDPHALGEVAGTIATTAATAGAAKAVGGLLKGAEVAEAAGAASKVDGIVNAIDEGGFKVTANPKGALQEGNVTITHPNEPGVKLNLRTETHPLEPGGNPVRHTNVERVEPGPKNRPQVKSNTHITE